MKSHIDILHDDALLLIFDFVFDRPSPKGDFCIDRPRSHLHREIQEMSRVCRRWASVLLSWPPARCHIIERSDFLRCGQGKLDVYLDQTDQELFTAVIGCREQIRQLHLLFDPIPYLPLDVSSSVMVSLTLTLWGREVVDVGGLSESGLPRLRKLRTIGKDVGVLRFRLLTHLCLEACTIGKGEMVEMLGMNVGLQELILCQMRWTNKSAVDPEVVVEMTELKWLRLDWGVASLVKSLKIGGKVAVRIQKMRRYASLGLPRSTGPAFEKLHIARFRSIAYFTALNEERFVQNKVLGLNRNLYRLVEDRILFRFVQELWIVEQQGWSEIKNWGMILESMEGLARMFVEGKNDTTYIIAPLSGLNGESKDIVCPRLEEQRLTETSLATDRLLKVVRLRNEKGRRLRVLEMRQMRIDKEGVNAMRKYVDELRVGDTREDWRMSVGNKFFEDRHDQWSVVEGGIGP